MLRVSDRSRVGVWTISLMSVLLLAILGHRIGHMERRSRRTEAEKLNAQLLKSSDSLTKVCFCKLHPSNLCACVRLQRFKSKQSEQTACSAMSPRSNVIWLCFRFSNQIKREC